MPEGWSGVKERDRPKVVTAHSRGAEADPTFVHAADVGYRSLACAP